VSPTQGNKRVTAYNGRSAHERVEDFLAHAIALEAEVADRYAEIAGSMQVHNNHEVAALFDKLARASHKHADQMKARSEGLTLPEIAPWDLQWGDVEAPETPSMSETHYLMTAYHALDLARDAEIKAQNYYTAVAEDSKNPDVCKLALEFAYEEAEHVDMINNLITRYPKPQKGWDLDLDPPANPG